MVASRKRTAVLISGRGSNMKALVEAVRPAQYPARIALVISNNHDAPGLGFAASQGIATEVVDHREHDTRDAFEARLSQVLKDHQIELIALAGFMRVLGADFVNGWHGRIINIHPSLLPDYKGLHTHERALADGRRVHGCSVHFVTAELDGGPVIAQSKVPVSPGDTPETLAARVLEQEHILYPRVLADVASGATKIENLA